MAVYEGAWDCPACGRKGNRGPEKHCAGCGSPRGEEVELYLPEDAPEVSDPEALARAGSGPDWSCPYCGGDNRADADFCTGCGAPREGAETREVVEHRGPARGAPQPPQATAAAAPVDPGKPGKPKAKKGRRGCLLGCLGLLAVAAAVLFLGRPRETTLTVSGFAWERTVAVEGRQLVRDEAWEGEVPEGARVLSSRKEVYEEEKVQTGTQKRTRTVTERVQTGTERVKVGVRDLGNGYFEDVYEERPVYETVERQETVDEPVYRGEPNYRDRIRYELEQWKPVRTARSAGQNRSPAWPRLSLGRDERAGPREETYTVYFTDPEGEVVQYEAAGEEEWKRFQPGRSYHARVKGDRVKSIGGPAGG